MIIFFGSDVKPSFELSTSINSIDTQLLPHALSFEIFPSRKWPQIEIRTHKTFPNFNFKSLALSICRRPSGGRFPRTPYYSSSWDGTSCSTSHWKWFAFREITGFSCFFLIHEKIRKFTFSQFFRNDHFFRLRCETFFRIFNLDKIYRHTIPSAWPGFRDFSFSEMVSNQNLNG